MTGRGNAYSPNSRVSQVMDSSVSMADLIEVTGLKATGMHPGMVLIAPSTTSMVEATCNL